MYNLRVLTGFWAFSFRQTGQWSLQWPRKCHYYEYLYKTLRNKAVTSAVTSSKHCSKTILKKRNHSLCRAEKTRGVRLFSSLENETQSRSSHFFWLFSFSFGATMTVCKNKQTKKWLYYCTQQPLLKYIKHATIPHSEQESFNNIDLWHTKDFRLNLLLTKCTGLWDHWTLLLQGSW